MKKIFIVILFITSYSYSQITVSKKLEDPANKIVQKLTKRSQVWIAGEWTIEKKQYVWTQGYWTDKRPGYIFITGYWEKRKEGWSWVPGTWRKISIESWNNIYS